jgi:signal transduction histidine kinase
MLRRYALTGPCQLGRDPVMCPVAMPTDPSVSRMHGAIIAAGGQWLIQDQGSRNGIQINGRAIPAGEGEPLSDGDRITLGDWTLSYSEGYPGLDGVNFIERVGDLFEEARLEPSPLEPPEIRSAQALALVRGLELLHRSTESLLLEGTSNSMFHDILCEALKFLSADRGFVVMVDPSGGWKSLHRIGDVEDRVGLSHSVVDYVLGHRTAVLSNAPMIDPRFGGESLVELHRGALMCVPMEIGNEIQGVLYLDRSQEGRPFSRFDLALLKAFVRQGAVALRHTQLAQRGIAQAETQGELLRLKALHERTVTRTGELLGAMASSLRWIQSYSESGYGDRAAILRNQAVHLQYLVDSGLQETLLDAPRETPVSTSLQSLQEIVEPAWRDLLRIRNVILEMDRVPAGTIWVAGSLASQALMSLVEPVLMQVAEGATVHGQWQDQDTDWTLCLKVSSGTPIPTPDPWTLHTLQEAGLVWRWSDQSLSLVFPKDINHTPDGPAQPLLGLVTESFELIGLFESVALAGELTLMPLEAEPPRSPVSRLLYLVVDFKGTADPVACVEAYRRSASFATVPILVVRAPDELFPELLAAGTTDCLPEGFRWETLHHRLQVLKGHDELQKKALAAERLDSLRQMAGTLKHEINNPLAVISMQIELLSRKYPEEPKLAKVMEMVERIRVLVQVLQKMRESSVEEYPGGGETILRLG